MKLCILIAGHKSAIYTQLENAVRETWLTVKPPDVDVYFYYGESIKNEVFCKGDRIHVPSPEGIPNLGQKTIQAFEWLLQNRDFTHLLRTNLSSYWDIDQFKQFLVTKPATGLYCGKIFTEYAFPFVSGAGIILSRDIVQLIVANKEQWDHSLIDDVSLCKFLSSLGVTIYPEHTERIDVENESDMYKNGYHYRVKSLKDRKIDEYRLREIHRIKVLGLSYVPVNRIKKMKDHVSGLIRNIGRKKFDPTIRL